MEDAEVFAGIFRQKIEEAMQSSVRCELKDEKTGLPIAEDERKDFLARLFVEIAKGMGLDRFVQTPAVILDQFSVMSVVKDHDTGGMLLSLTNSFLIAYSNPETTDRAFAALEQLEALRAEAAEGIRVAARKGSMH